MAEPTNSEEAVDFGLDSIFEPCAGPHDRPPGEIPYSQELQCHFLDHEGDGRFTGSIRKRIKLNGAEHEPEISPESNREYRRLIWDAWVRKANVFAFPCNCD